MNTAFYHALSSYYDALFPASPADMAFLNSQLPPSGTLLDVGSGTGNKTVLLARPGRTLVGVDADAEMIARARAEHTAPGLTYVLGSMYALDTALSGQYFDAVLCLGNTLVHGSTETDIRRAFTQISERVNATGMVVLQILNYAHLIQRHHLLLPLIETDCLRFQRAYTFADGTLHFKSSLEIKPDNVVLENDTILYPLEKDTLHEFLRHAGYTRISWYGTYEGRPFQEDDFMLMCIARFS